MTWCGESPLSVGDVLRIHYHAMQSDGTGSLTNLWSQKLETPDCVLAARQEIQGHYFSRIKSMDSRFSRE